jgi:Aldehyde dehydrogenase family
VWSNDAAEQDVIRHLDAGAVFLNGMTVPYLELPFGGVKDTGYGRELAGAGIREFCNLKTVWKARAAVLLKYVLGFESRTRFGHSAFQADVHGRCVLSGTPAFTSISTF